MRYFGTAVFIYAFMNAYYGVGASKNALMLNMSYGLLPWLLASAYALFWLLYLIGSVGLILKKAGSGKAIMAASGGSAMIMLLSFLIFHSSGDVALQYSLFHYARPLPDIFIFATSLILSRTGAGLPEPVAGKGRMMNAVIIAAAAAIPWIARAAASQIQGIPSASPKPFMALFISVWSCGPAAMLIFISMALRRVFPDAAALIKASGFAGIISAGAYVYMLIWLQNMNNFLLALSPPFIIAGMFLGISAGSGLNSIRMLKR